MHLTDRCYQLIRTDTASSTSRTAVETQQARRMFVMAVAVSLCFVLLVCLFVPNGIQ